MLIVDTDILSTQMRGCQQNLINQPDVLPVLEFICSESNKLTNCGIYYARQLYFKTQKFISKFELNYEMKRSKNSHYQFMHSQAAQQALISVAESFRSFVGLLKAFKKGKIDKPPQLPKYRPKGGLEVVSYPQQALKLTVQGIRIPLGKKVKACFGVQYFYLQMLSNLEFKKIKELRILPRNGCFYAEFIYSTEEMQADVDLNNCLGIDAGVDNWLTCVSNQGDSFIINGRTLKSQNRYYNKEVARLKTNQPQGFWSKRLAAITEKRNRQMRDSRNKTARLLLNYCLEQRIGRVVWGHNQQQKQECHLGKANTQNFVQIPTTKLKERFKQLCEQYAIEFVETEESYTSKASFLDGDELPVFGAKPEGWTPSGRRVKRGLYKTASGWLINSDANGAVNIMQKVATRLGIDLTRVSRAVLTQPRRIHLHGSTTSV
ncbi:MAG: RNA-guided endonuclease InsQ/TnpB family protein [Microcoleaceae cyanobacterium]